jgi:hypothetical protein
MGMQRSEKLEHISAALNRGIPLEL